MQRTTLGKTGLKTSPLCIGAWQLGGPLAFNGKADGHPDPGKEQVIRMIRTLGDRGINFIDTAEQYSSGESERRVGEALQGHRDQWVISTKFGYRVGPNGTRNDSSAAHTIRPSIEGSLKRLNTDYLDIYLYHCPPTLDQLDEGKEILDQLVQEGKCRHYGISTEDPTIVEAMIQRDMIDVLQYPSNLLRPNDQLRQLTAQHNIGTQIRGIMAQGRLSGKYFQKQPTWDQNDNRSHTTGGDDYTKYAPLQELIPEGMTMSQLIIRYTLDNPQNHSICLGAKSLKDYETALAALDLPPFEKNLITQLETRTQTLA